jgi:hypothetical protein
VIVPKTWIGVLAPTLASASRSVISVRHRSRSESPSSRSVTPRTWKRQRAPAHSAMRRAPSSVSVEVGFKRKSDAAVGALDLLIDRTVVVKAHGQYVGIRPHRAQVAAVAMSRPRVIRRCWLVAIGRDSDGFRLVDAAVEDYEIGDISELDIEPLGGQVERADETDTIEVVSKFTIEACDLRKAAAREGRNEEGRLHADLPDRTPTWVEAISQHEAPDGPRRTGTARTRGRCGAHSYMSDATGPGVAGRTARQPSWSCPRTAQRR